MGLNGGSTGSGYTTGTQRVLFFSFQDMDHITRIIHISDLHLRSSAQTELTDALQSLRRLLETEITHREQTVIVVTGDVLDEYRTRSIDACTIALLLNLLCILNNGARRCIIIPGNHDLKNGGCLGAFLSTELPMWPRILYSETGEIDEGNLRFHIVPASPVSIKPEAALCLPSVNDPQRIHIGLHHGPCNPASGLNVPDGYTLVLLGDLHEVRFAPSRDADPEHVGVTNSGPHRWQPGAWAYAGSMVQKTHGERCDDHGLLVWDLVARTCTFRPVCSGILRITIDRVDPSRGLLHDEKRDQWIACDAAILRNTKVRMVVKGITQEVIQSVIPTHIDFVIDRHVSTPSTAAPWNAGPDSCFTTDSQEFHFTDSRDAWTEELDCALRAEDPARVDAPFMRRIMTTPGHLLDGHDEDRELRQCVQQCTQDMSTEGLGYNETTIERIEAQNVLGLKDVDLTLLGAADIVLLTGPNASGKSSLFECVCLGLFGSLPRKRQGSTTLSNTERFAGYLRGDAGRGYVRLKARITRPLPTVVTILRQWVRGKDTTDISETVTITPKPHMVDHKKETDRWLEDTFGKLEDFVASSMLTQFQDGSLFSKEQKKEHGARNCVNEVRDFYTRLAFLQPLDNMIHAVRRALHLREARNKDIHCTIEKMQDMHHFLTVPTADVAEESAAELEQKIRNLWSQRESIMAVKPRAGVRSGPRVLAQGFTVDLYLQRWGTHWKTLEDDCSRVVSMVNVLLENINPSDVLPPLSTEELRCHCTAVEERLSEYRQWLEPVDRAGAKRRVPLHVQEPAVWVRTQLEANKHKQEMILRAHETDEDGLCARYQQLPDVPPWNKPHCARILQETSCAPLESDVENLRDTVNVAKHRRDETERIIASHWKSMHVDYNPSHSTVTRALRTLQQYPDAAGLHQQLEDAQQQKTRHHEARCMQQWRVIYSTWTCKCKSCIAIETVTQQQPVSATSDYSNLETAIQYHKDAGHWFALDTLYRDLQEQITQFNHQQEMLRKNEGDLSNHRALSHKKEIARTYMQTHDELTANARLIEDHGTFLLTKRSQPDYELLLAMYSAEDALRTAAAKLDGHMGTTACQAHCDYDATISTIEGLITHLKSQRPQNHHDLLTTQRIREEFRQMQCNGDKLETVCTTLRVMKECLSAHRSRVLHRVNERLCHLVTKFCKPVGLELKGWCEPRDQRFRWSVKALHATGNDWIGASGFEKCILEFTARVAMCLLSNARCRYTQLFVDEGFTSADGSNQGRLPGLIAEIAKCRRFHSILLVTHMPALMPANGLFEGTPVTHIRLKKSVMGAVLHYPSLHKRARDGPG